MKHFVAPATLLLALAASLGGCASSAPSTDFILSSPDLAGGSFDNKFVLNGFGCKGDNLSPTLIWRNPPAGTKSFAVQMYDPDAPTGSGFWHWAVYNLPANTVILSQGVGNRADRLPAGAFGGNTDFLDTGATGGNGNYGGPCPPVGDRPHRYVFTVYALAVDKLEVAGGVPRSGTAGLYGFVLNKGIGAAMLGKASFTATYGR